MPLYKQPRSPFYWYDIRVNGKRYRGSTKEKSLTVARQFEAALITKLSEGQTPSFRKRIITLAEFSPRFLEFVKSSRLDADTKAYYQNGWRMLATQSISQMRIDAISTSSAHSVNPSGSGANVNCALRTLRRMLSLAHEWCLVQRRPRIHMVAECRRERLIRPEEEVVILAKANETLRDIFTIIMDTGARPSEAVGLAWENVDFVKGTVFVTNGKTRNARRKLDISGRVKELLTRRAAKGGTWVFPSSRRPGEHIKSGSVVVMFSQLKRDLGFPRELVLYCARHTFATDYQAVVRDLTKTSKQLGHGSTAITERYVHPQTENLGSIMDSRNAERHTFAHTAFPVQ